MSEAAGSSSPLGGGGFVGWGGPARLLSDDRLAERAAKGDRRAFEAIYRRYHQELYRFCLVMVGTPEDAQDALQNTMVKVLRALPGETRSIRLKPWLYRIARNESVEVLRRRRDSAETEPDHLPAPLAEVAETAEARERLRRLIADLEELPERQRAALVMREMAGLGFEQIGESFDTSAAVARQTVYEARLSLRQMEAGREMDCEAVTRALSDGDGRVARRREVRAHLKDCASCREFRDAIAERRGDLAAIGSLPLAASAGLLQSVLAGGGASAGKAALSATVVKSVATVAVVSVVGVSVAERGGVVDLPLPGGGSDAAVSGPPSHSSSPPSAAPVPGGAGGSGRDSEVVERAGAVKLDRGRSIQNGSDGSTEAKRQAPAIPAADPARSPGPPAHAEGRGRSDERGVPPEHARSEGKGTAKGTPPGQSKEKGGKGNAGGTKPAQAGPKQPRESQPGKSGSSPPSTTSKAEANPQPVEAEPPGKALGKGGSSREEG